MICEIPQFRVNLDFEFKITFEIQNRNRMLVSWDGSFKRLERLAPKKLRTFSNILVHLFRLYVWILCDTVMNSNGNWVENSIYLVNEADSVFHKMIIDYCVEHLTKKTAVLLKSTMLTFFNGKLFTLNT